MKNYSLCKVPKDVVMEVATRFKSFRKAHKLSQLELATKSGVSLGSLKRFENTGQIAFESLLKLAHFFDRLDDFEELFKMEDNLKEIEKLFK